MAKTSMIEREFKRERLVKKFAEKRSNLKKLRKDCFVSGEIPWEANENFQKLPRNSSPTRVVRRCTICGRPKAVYRRFKMCRLCLRKNAMLGYVPGLVKSSW